MPGMDAELQAKVDAELTSLARGGSRGARTEKTYAQYIAGSWAPYARTNALPEDVTAGGSRPLAGTEIARFIAACAVGDTRRGTRDGARATERAGTALSVATLEVVLSALRARHVDAGLVWNGSSPQVRGLVAGYRRTHGAPKVKAAPMTVEQVSTMFAQCNPVTIDGLRVREAHVRAVAVALRLPLVDLARLDPSQVRWEPTRVIVNSGAKTIETQCLRTEVNDVVAEAACGHCILGAWTASACPPPLIHRADIGRLRRLSATAAGRLGLARFVNDHLTVRGGDVWTTIALGLPAEVARWLRMRAALLPMRAVGLRLDDLDGLGTSGVAFRAGNVTLSVVGKTESVAQPHVVVLEATGDALCPVAAMRHYDAWTRAFLPARTAFLVPLRGQGDTYYPVDVTPGPGRALYQSVREWLLRQGLELAGEATPRLRANLTPHSARRGFAGQAKAEGHREDAIQEALRHSRAGTTAGYLDGEIGSESVAGQVLNAIADGSRR